jgi:hypothetical protein
MTLEAGGWRRWVWFLLRAFLLPEAGGDAHIFLPIFVELDSGARLNPSTPPPPPNQLYNHPPPTPPPLPKLGIFEPERRGYRWKWESTETKFLIPYWGDKVDSGKGLSYWLQNLAGLYDNPMDYILPVREKEFSYRQHSLASFVGEGVDTR